MTCPPNPQDPSEWPPQVRGTVDPENPRRLNVAVRIPALPAASDALDAVGRVLGVERDTAFHRLTGIRRESDDDFRERILDYMRPRHQTLYSATGDIELERDGLRQLRRMITDKMVAEWQFAMEHPPLEPPRTTCWQYILSEDAA